MIIVHLNEGGSGSGNFGHRDVKGKRGGSAPSGKLENKHRGELYHGTSSKFIADIKKNGIKPGGNGYVYAADQKAVALSFGWDRTSQKNAKIALVVVSDKPFTPEETGQGYFRSSETIDPKYIKRIEFYNEKDVSPQPENNKDWLPKPVKVVESDSEDGELYIPFLIDELDNEPS